MYRAASASLALLFVSSGVFAQTPHPPAPPPAATPPQPPLPDSGPHRDHEGDREDRGEHRRAEGGHGEHDGPHHGDMPHDAIHLAAMHGEHGEEAQRTHVNVDSGAKNAILERKVMTQESFGHVAIALPMHLSTDSWEQVCVAPCQVALPRHSSYRIATGNDMPGTSSFTLSPNHEHIDLRVKPGNLGRFATGGLLTGLGIGAFVTGAVLFSAAGKFHDESNVRVAGAITGGAGLVLLAIGIPLLILNQTHVYADGQKLALRAPERRGIQLRADGFAF